MTDWLERIAAAIQNVLPQAALTAIVYRLMRITTPWFKDFQIRLISTIVGVDWSEAKSRDPGDYRHFNAFFTRQLKENARPPNPDNAALISPCDGRISELGQIDGEQIFQAKGHHYSLQALLADDPDREQWLNGSFYTIYLSPRDYHRVHMPIDGTLKRMSYVPGRLFSVAPYTVRQIPGLFARNERLVSVFDTQIGPIAQVLVGAMLVASMETVWAGEITPNPSKLIQITNYQDQDIKIARGREMGRFNMGSTVILVLPKGSVDIEQALSPGGKVKMGQRLAKLNF